MPDLDLVDMGGVGGTLAGNPVSIAAMRATLREVLTDDALTAMIELADRFGDGVDAVIDEHGLPWSVSRLGARVEYRFADPAPRTGSESAAAHDAELEDYLHTYLANRGVLLDAVPQHGADVPGHHRRPTSTATREVFAAAMADLTRLCPAAVARGPITASAGSKSTISPH